MGISPIWKRLEQSQLVSQEQVQELREEYQRQQPPTQAITDDHICEWLVQQKAITRYQSEVFLAGHHGPFDYGDYRVDDRVITLPRKGAFRARHRPTGCRVLLRFHDPRHGHMAWPDVAERVHAVQPIHHHAVSRAFEALDLEQFRFVVMSDDSGETLAALLRRKTKLSTKRSCRLMFQIASGIGSLHQQRLVHGAIRPENILVDKQGAATVWFDPMQRPHNLAELNHADEDTQRLQARYLAPELVDRTREPDVLSDVYAMGCIFYEMLSGHPPFDGASVLDVMAHHAATPMAPLTSLGIPEPLEKVVAFMMAKNAELRYQQADVVAAQVSKILKAAKALPDKVPPAMPASEQELLDWLQSHGQSGFPADSHLQSASPVATRDVTTSQTPASTANAVEQVQTPIPVVSDSTAAGVAPLIQVSDDRLTRAKQRNQKRGKSGKLNPMLIGIIGGAVALFALAIVFAVWAMQGEGVDNGASQITQSEQDGTIQDADNNTTQVTAGFAPFEQQVVTDDGDQLWETPTVGAPLDMSFVPSGLRVVIALRPASLLNQEEGVLLVRSLGDQFGEQLGALESTLGVRLDRVDQMLIGFHDNDGNRPRASYRIRMQDGTTADELSERWGATFDPDSSNGDLRVYRGPSELDFLVWPVKDDQSVHSFLAASRADIEGVVRTEGAPPVMRQELRQLLRYSDVERHVSIAAIPSSLFNDEGRQLFPGNLAYLLGPLEQLTGVRTGAAMASFHLDDGLYLETMLKDLDNEPYQLADEYSAQLSELCNDFSTYVFTLGSNPYWNRIRMRFANWISLIQANTRVGVENQVVIGNCWLPLPAAHNLAAASELSLASIGGGTTEVSADSSSSDNSTPKNIDELLTRKFTLSIPRNDLVLILEELKQTVTSQYRELSFPFDIKMLGNDLLLEGITQNQSVNNFEMENQPLHAILTSLMERAFTAPGVEGPSDPNFKLIWVVSADPDQPDKRIILITTRAAAVKNNYQLPAAFKPNEE